MFKITINGKPFSEDVLNSAVLEAAKETVMKRISAALTPDEISKLKFDYESVSKTAFRLVISGPEELTAKARLAAEAQ